METTKSKVAPKTNTSDVKKKDAGKSTARKTTSRKSSTTTNHDEIKKWVEDRSGTPSMVKGTGSEGDSGILRIDFPGYKGKDTLVAISWEDFFSKFDDSKLQFLYQEKTSKGTESRFNKFVSKS